jgi:hypothetical protein
MSATQFTVDPMLSVVRTEFRVDSRVEVGGNSTMF